MGSLYPVLVRIQSHHCEAAFTAHTLFQLMNGTIVSGACQRRTSGECGHSVRLGTTRKGLMAWRDSRLYTGQMVLYVQSTTGMKSHCFLARSCDQGWWKWNCLVRKSVDEFSDPGWFRERCGTEVNSIGCGLIQSHGYCPVCTLTMDRDVCDQVWLLCLQSPLQMPWHATNACFHSSQTHKRKMDFNVSQAVRWVVLKVSTVSLFRHHPGSQ